MLDFPTLIGLVGVSGILLAYFLNLFHWVQQDSYTYLLINLAGAGLACWSSVLIRSLPFTILEAVWCAVSVVALARKLGAPPRSPGSGSAAG